MPHNPWAALHWQTMGFVEHEQMIIPIDDHLLDLFDDRWIGGDPGGRRRLYGHRRDPHGLPRDQAGRGFDALSVDPYLTGTAQFLDRVLRQAGKMPPEPAVQSEVCFVVGDGLYGYGHSKGWRMILFLSSPGFVCPPGWFAPGFDCEVLVSVCWYISEVPHETSPFKGHRGFTCPPKNAIVCLDFESL